MPLRPNNTLTVAHWRRLEAIRTAAVASVSAQWQRSTVDTISLDETVARVLAAQRATVAATDADISLMAGITTRTATTPIGLNSDRLIGARARGGVSLETVYARSRKVVRESGFEQGLVHLRTAIALDTQLAQRHAAAAMVQADNRVVGWRRQVNPVAGGKTCGLCVAASTQTYHKQHLLPIHPACRCTVYPVMSSDPIRGAVIDRERLDAVYAAAGEDRSRSGLGKVRFSPDDLPAGIDSTAITELGPRVAWHPEIGEFLTGTRHDSSFSV